MSGPIFVACVLGCSGWGHDTKIKSWVGNLARRKHASFEECYVCTWCKNWVGAAAACFFLPQYHVSGPSQTSPLSRSRPLSVPVREQFFFHPTIRMNFTFHRLVWKRLDAGVKNDYVTKIPEKMLQSIFDSLDDRNLPIFNAYSKSEYAFTVSPTRPPTCKILLFPHSCGWGKTTLDTGWKMIISQK